LFSFGAVLYEMATGRMAFSGNTSAMMFDAILHKAPTAAVRLNPELPLELERIISKALEKDAAMRYQNAADLLSDLKRLRRDSSSARISAAEPATVARPAEPFSSKTFPWKYGVGAAALALAIGAAAWFGFRSRASKGEINSVAVLPFSNQTGSPDTEYLSDGITESLINDLSKLPKLAVMSRSSVFRYKGRDVDPQAVAKDLKVDAVVTGRVLQHADQLVVSAELIDAATNHNLWGDRYDRKLSDLVTVQQDISGAIAGHLRERLSGQEATAVAKGGTRDPEAYQLYLKGKYYWDKRTQESLEKSKDYFNQAIAKDPNYAMAYIGLAQYYYVVSDYSPISNTEAAPKARAAAEKALQLDDTLAEPHAVLAGVDTEVFEWDAAEQEFRRALELNPNDGTTRLWYALMLSQLGRSSEGIAQVKRAIELEPLNLKYNDGLGVMYNAARQYDMAVEQFKKTLEMDPNYASAIANLGYVYRNMGKYDLWLEQWKKAASLNNDHEELAIANGVAQVYSKSGYEPAVRREIELTLELAKRRYVDPATIAFDYADLGEKDKAFAWLEKAYAEKSNSSAYIKVFRQMDNLRSDPRYAALLKKMGLPQ